MAIDTSNISFINYLWTKKNSDGTITGIRLSKDNLPEYLADPIQILAGKNISITPTNAGLKISAAADGTVKTVNTISPDPSGNVTVPIPTAGTTASAVSTTASGGSATTWSKSDHVHNISLATGDNNGQVKIAGTNVSVKGLGSAAYTNSTAYATSGHTHNFSQINSRGEAFLDWGGKNFSGSYGPIDAAMVPELGANRLAFMPANAVTIEYSRDGGSTWTDYGPTDSQKINLFNGNGSGFTIGKATSGAGNIATNQYQLRVNIYTSAAKVYTVLNKFVILVSTNGTNNNWCTIRARLQKNYTDNVNTWTTFADKVSVAGWSGYNVINTSGLTTYGNTVTTQYGHIQFIFGCNTGSTNNSYAGLQIIKIFGFGGVGWTTPSTIAKNGLIYTYDASQNVTFPAAVAAKSFTENGTSLANKYLGKTAKAADADKLDGNDSAYYLNYNNLTNKPTIPAAANNGTITIKQTGISDQTFTVNQSGNKTITLVDTNTWRPLGTGASDACAGNDPRLSNARTPTAHTHTSNDVTDALTLIQGNNITLTQTASGLKISAAADGKVKTVNNQEPDSNGNVQLTLDHINDGSTRKLANYVPKSLTTTKGDIIYASAANTPARLGIGSNGQFLSIANGIPKWVNNPNSDTHYVNSLQIKGNGTEAVKFTQNADKSLNLKPGNNVSISAASGEITISSTNTNTSHGHSAGVGLVGSGNAGTSGTYTYKAKLKSETPLTIDSAAETTLGKVYPIAVDKSGYLSLNAPLAGFEDILKGIKGRTQVEWNALNVGEYGSNSTYNGTTLPPIILENNSGFWNSASGRPLDVSFHFTKKEKITTLQVKCPPYSGVNSIMSVYYAQEGDTGLTLYKEIATISTADSKTYEFNEEGISADYWVIRFTSSGWIDLRLCSPGGLFTTGLYTKECHQQIMDRFGGYQPIGNYALKSEIPTKSSWNYDDTYVKYSAAQSLNDTQKAQARTNIGAGTSNFTGYTSSNKLHTDYINNAAGWTSNTGTVTSVRVQAGTGLSSSQNTAQTSTLNTTISIASGYKLPTTTEWAERPSINDAYSISAGNGIVLTPTANSLKISAALKTVNTISPDANGNVQLTAANVGALPIDNAVDSLNINKELACGSNGKICVGKFGVYDSNITLNVSSTTSNTYSGTIVIATQNGIICNAKVYGDATKALSNILYIAQESYNSNRGVVGVYLNLAGWSKNKIDIRCLKLDKTILNTYYTDLMTSITAMPTYSEGAPNTATSAPKKYTGTTNDIFGAIPTSLKNPKALTFGSKTYDGSSAQTITASDLGALTSHQDISGKQDTLVSGTNIKTINGNSILGSGDLTISGGGGSISVATYSTLGGIKPWCSTTGASTYNGTNSYTTSPEINSATTTSGRFYPICTDKNGRAYVNVPWTNTTYSNVAIMSSGGSSNGNGSTASYLYSILTNNSSTNKKLKIFCRRVTDAFNSTTPHSISFTNVSFDKVPYVAIGVYGTNSYTLNNVNVYDVTTTGCNYRATSNNGAAGSAFYIIAIQPN